MITPRITEGRTRVCTRMRGPLRRTRVTLHLGQLGIDTHLGQKPKLGGGTPTPHSSPYHVLLVLCIFMFSFSF